MAGIMGTIFCIWLALFTILFECDVLMAKIACRDNEGNAVDWFVAYKLPKLRDQSNPDIQKGLGLFYMDKNYPKWTLLTQNINKSGEAIYNTLDQIYTNHQSQDVAYILYNDETPEKNVSYSHGHTKGDIAFDKQTGFWLVHSVPRFPPYVRDGYSYIHSAQRYGQTFLCVTYNYKTFNVIGSQLLYNYPQVYDSNLPDSLARDNSNLQDVINNQRVCSKPYYKVQDLLSDSGQSFTSFAKCTQFYADLYHDLLAKYYKKDFLAETWRLGEGVLPSNCTGYKVNNILNMTIVGVNFKSTDDHSKWAISADGNITCIGDINREHAQLHRCGGTVCFNIPEVWKAFRSSVSRVAPCPNRREP